VEEGRLQLVPGGGGAKGTPPRALPRFEVVRGGEAGFPTPRPEGLPGLGDPAGFRILGQVDQTYLLVATETSLFVVDQHAAHERVLFEEILGQLEEGAAPSQEQLIPETLDLSEEEFAALEEHRGRIERMGFVLEPFGGRSVVVRSIPRTLRRWEDGRLLREVLQAAGEGARSEGDDLNKRLAATFACRASVMAGDSMTAEETRALVDRLFRCEIPTRCPHGRPTLLELTYEELAQRFCRK
jgi:DNA mismatch repair protein MutL